MDKNKAIVFFSLLFFLPLKAAILTTVTAPKATIYTSPTLTTPIGYLKQGQQIEIGDKLQNLDRAASLIVSGKIVYIKTQDLALSKSESGEIQEKESVISRDIPDEETLPLQKASTSLSNINFQFSVQKITPDDAMKTMLEENGQTYMGKMGTEFWPYRLIGAGLDLYALYLKSSQKQVHSFGAVASLSLAIPLGPIALYGKASYLHSPGGIFTYAVNKNVQYNGQAYGSEYSAFLGIKIKKVELRGGAGIQTFHITDLKHIYSIRGTKTLPKMKSTTNFVLLSLAFYLD